MTNVRDCSYISACLAYVGGYRHTAHHVPKGVLWQWPWITKTSPWPNHWLYRQELWAVSQSHFPVLRQAVLGLPWWVTGQPDVVHDTFQRTWYTWPTAYWPAVLVVRDLQPICLGSEVYLPAVCAVCDYDLIGKSRETDMPSSQLQCCCWVEGMLGDALQPAPFLVYVSLFLLDNKWTWSIRLALRLLLRNSAVTSPHWWFWWLADRETPERQIL